MTKNELIAKMQHDCVNQQGEYQDGVRYGALRMYDHRQKEIDDANRWWSVRWQKIRELQKQKQSDAAVLLGSLTMKELDAAAARVMEDNHKTK